MEGFDSKVPELKVFTLPTCSSCHAAKQVALEVSRKLGLAYREVDMNTKEGLEEGTAYQIMSTPSITLGDEVIVVGRLISKEKLEEEVCKRLAKWRARAFQVKPP
ncbi:MAG: thioredoxin family protein [Nitrososphaerota archaeon]|nr:thioredoxin family protein [Candidatus Bathyarchaeota archaeon]MDW8022775.1 thioredoxin family protein [Nitrososphaerota archaeon]